MDGIYEHQIYIHKTPDETLNSGDMVVNKKKIFYMRERGLAIALSQIRKIKKYININFTR